MILPIRTDSPLRSTPYANYLIILANIAIYVLVVLKPLLQQRYALLPHDPRLVQYITYAFLHANVLHIVSNMLFLFIFGNNVNDKMGNLGYTAFYLAGAVFAGVAYVVTQHAPAPVVGASGAVAAVTGAYLILFPRSNITLLIFFFAQFEVSSFYFIVFFFAQDVVLNFAKDSNVAHMAHIGGTLFGVVVCFTLLAAQLLPRDQFDVLALLGRWNKRRQYRDMVARGYDPFGYSPNLRQEEVRPQVDPNFERIQDLRAQISDAMAHNDLAKAASLYQQVQSIDPNQVLARQAQLDIANQLASQQAYPAAANAYELFLKQYPNFEQIEQVELMLGLIYARYLARYDRAKEVLLKACAKLHGERESRMAKEELARIEPMLVKASTTQPLSS